MPAFHPHCNTAFGVTISSHRQHVGTLVQNTEFEHDGPGGMTSFVLTLCDEGLITAKTSF